MDNLTFKAIIPKNCQKSLSNGDIRITLDCDEQEFSEYMGSFQKMSGMMVQVAIVPIHDYQIKTAHDKLLNKVHALMGQIARKHGLSLDEYKRLYKEKNGVQISFRAMDDESLGKIADRLEKIIESEGING